MDAFSPDRGPIIIDLELSGPAATAWARLILDTGATMTMIKPGALIDVGYDLDSLAELVSVATVDGVRKALGCISTGSPRWANIGLGFRSSAIH